MFAPDFTANLVITRRRRHGDLREEEGNASNVGSRTR